MTLLICSLTMLTAANTCAILCARPPRTPHHYSRECTGGGDMSSYDPRSLHNINRDQIQLPLIRKALTDSAYRKKLNENPRAEVSKQLGIELPPEVKITVLQESVDHFYLVL